MRVVFPTPPRWQINVAKLMGATMWCWIFWRLKQDWRELLVRHWDTCGSTPGVEGFSLYCLLGQVLFYNSRVAEASTLDLSWE